MAPIIPTNKLKNNILHCRTHSNKHHETYQNKIYNFLTIFTSPPPLSLPESLYTFILNRATTKRSISYVERSPIRGRKSNRQPIGFRSRNGNRFPSFVITCLIRSTPGNRVRLRITRRTWNNEKRSRIVAAVRRVFHSARYSFRSINPAPSVVLAFPCEKAPFCKPRERTGAPGSTRRENTMMGLDATSL